MANIAWPDLKPLNFGFYHIDDDQSGGQGVGGGEQFVISPGPRWGASGTWAIRTNAEVLAWRALRSQLKGRANPAILPNFDGKRLSWPVETFGGNSTGRVLTPRVAHEIEGTLGLDGTAYAGLEIPASAEINATVNADAAIRATTVVLNKTKGEPFIAGQQFGVTALRIYEIATIVSVVGAVTTVTIWPPLRAAVTATTPVRFTRPTCLMRCLNLGDELRKLEQLRFATLNLEFVEYF